MLPAVESVHGALVDNGVVHTEQTMTLEKVFWSHFCTNLAPASWVIGALVIGFGLDFFSGLLALIAGNVLGALPVALCATMGPKTGLTQIETSRFSFGRLGTRVPAFLNWTSSVGWDAVNNVSSTLALLALAGMLGLRLPFWLGLASLSIIQLAAGMYGHHLVQLITKYLGYVLTAVFAVTEVVAIVKGGSFSTSHANVTPAVFLFAVSMVAGNALGFAAFTSDYTRYLPRATPSWKVFSLSFTGSVISGFALELCGLLTASRLTDLSAGGVISAIAGLVGPFAPIALIAVAISSIAANSLNDNTAAYSLMSAGLRIPRHLAAVVTAVLGYALAVAGAGKFTTLFSNYLIVLAYWVAPWAGIVIADRLLFRNDSRQQTRWGVGAWIFVFVTPTTIALFSSNELFVGPVARALGGTDIGVFVGFFGAAALYVFAERRRRRIASPTGTVAHVAA
jgi:nucleobase:cation symporter-1, NCS1 family